MSTGMIVRPMSDPREDALADMARSLKRAESLLSEETLRRRTAESDLEDAQRENRNLTEGLRRLRGNLSPLYDSLRLLFGDMELLGVEDAPAATGSGQTSTAKSAVWESWKAKLPSGEAKAIDALLVHGTLSTPQVRIHVGCATRTSQNIVQALKSKGLIIGDGTGWSLKPL